MVLIVPNPTRTALHSEALPDGPLTERQRAIADAVRGCHSLADFVAAPREAVTSITVSTIRLGTSETAAQRLVEDGIAKARTELDRLERLVGAYGPAPFMPQAEGVKANGLTGTSRHAVLVAVLRRITAAGRTLVRAGDRPVRLDGSGAYVVERPT